MYSIFLVSLSMHVQSMEHHETNTLSLIFQLLFLDQFRLTSIVHVHQDVELPTLIFAGFLLAMYLSLHSLQWCIILRFMPCLCIHHCSQYSTLRCTSPPSQPSGYSHSHSSWRASPASPSRCLISFCGVLMLTNRISRP